MDNVTMSKIINYLAKTYTTTDTEITDTKCPIDLGLMKPNIIENLVKAEYFYNIDEKEYIFYIKFRDDRHVILNIIR